MLYFTMFIIFLLMIIGPIVASKFMTSLPTIPMQLLQPTGQNNNDTSGQRTGSALNGLGAPTGGGGAAATSKS